MRSKAIYIDFTVILFELVKAVQIKSNLFKLDSVRSGCLISRARGSCIKRPNWNLEVLVFEERGKPEYLEKNLSENQQQTQPTYDIASGNRTRGHIGGRRVLSPLHHPCSPLIQGLILFDTRTDFVWILQPDEFPGFSFATFIFQTYNMRWLFVSLTVISLILQNHSATVPEHVQRIPPSQTGQTGFPSLANPADEQTSRQKVQQWTAEVSCFAKVVTVTLTNRSRRSQNSAPISALSNRCQTSLLLYINRSAETVS